MNCQKFESIIDSVAREQMMEAGASTAALEHSAGCARCSARLGDERSLTAALRVLAVAAEAETAPKHIESALIAAFRQQAGSIQTLKRDTKRMTARRASGDWWKRAGAAAAIVLVALSLVVLRLQHSTPPATQENPASRSAAPPSTSAGEGRPNQPTKPAEPIRLKKNGPPRRNLLATRSGSEPAKGSDKTGSEGANAAGAAADRGFEIATDYIPLTYGTNSGPLDGGQVVRVELPRSALTALGLPMNAERLNERIKADVVLDNAGLARAIRFVR